MQVDIVTVYNTENSGSALQAYALANTLKEMHANVFFVYRPLIDTHNGFVRCCLGVGKSLSKLRFGEAKMKINIYSKFYRFQKKHFKIIKKGEVKNSDILVYGSDTLWNIQDQYFRRRRDLFWGEQFPQNMKVTYAMSVANTPASMFQEEYYQNNIRQFSQISVRDESSCEAVSGIYDKKIDLVLDPTLLLPKESYLMLADNKLPENIVLIYYFGQMDNSTIDEIKRFAKERALKTVSLGVSREWCDFNFATYPGIFIEGFQKAKYVFTNTFHGCCFSLIFQKEFIAFVSNKKKAKDFLCSVGAESRVADDCGMIQSTFQNKLDYEIVNKTIADYRKNSIEYLRNIIGEA